MHPAVRHHQGLAAGWEAKYQKGSFAGRERLIADRLARLDLAGKKWLDAGCGTGRLSRLLARGGCRVVGVDAAPAMLEAARRQAGAEGLGENPEFRQVATVEDLPFADGEFDGILCSSVLEYLDRPARCLAELSRTLKPGGALLLTAPNRLSLVRRCLAAVFRVTGLLGKPWPGWLAISRNEYSGGQLRGALEGHGFEVRELVPFGGPLPRGLQAVRLLGSLWLAVAAKKSDGPPLP
jgi:2-polyprenyl-6-hydroxyphenyl methylase/3-demethylubiquinone-9 3-methyltransferase